MDWSGCWHYNDADHGKVWALLIRRVDDCDSHIPELPKKGQWWVAAVSINRNELLNGYTNSKGMKVVPCPVTQQVNTVVELDCYGVSRTVRNPNKK